MWVVHRLTQIVEGREKGGGRGRQRQVDVQTTARKMTRMSVEEMISQVDLVVSSPSYQSGYPYAMMNQSISEVFTSRNP